MFYAKFRWFSKCMHFEGYTTASMDAAVEEIDAARALQSAIAKERSARGTPARRNLPARLADEAFREVADDFLLMGSYSVLEKGASLFSLSEDELDALDLASRKLQSAVDSLQSREWGEEAEACDEYTAGLEREASRGSLKARAELTELYLVQMPRKVES